MDKLVHLNGNSGYEIGEFFVMAKYAGQGVGETAAKFLFNKFPGKWQLQLHALNAPGIKFWKKVVAKVAVGEIAEVFIDDDSWCGPVLNFFC